MIHKGDLKAILQESMEESEKTITSLKGSLVNSTDKGLSTSNSQVTNHPADVGTELFEKELDMALINNEKDIKEKITSAIGRVESGDYEKCSQCSNMIEGERLEVLPYTDVCASCAKSNSMPDYEVRSDYINEKALENFYDMYSELEESGSYESEENLINLQSPDSIASGCVEKVEEISNEQYRSQF
ncbi:MAG: hypothetical protein RSB66_03005 [Clostridium sp.]